MRAYVVGNVAMDETYEVDALPKEGESILGTRRSSELGGKGANQAIVLARCGVPVTFIAGVGDDVRADKLRADLVREPVDTRLVTLPDLATDLSVVMADPRGGNAIMTTVDCARALDAATVVPVFAEAAPGDVMILQGNLSASVTLALFDMADNKGMAVVFNPSPVDTLFTALLGRARMLFLNEAEAKAYTGKTDEHAVQALLGLGSATIVMTRGAQGALLGTADGIQGVPAQSCRVVDTTGAGDTYQSVALAASMQSGAPMDAPALHVAAQAAAITISRFGTISALPSEPELYGLLASVA